MRIQTNQYGKLYDYNPIEYEEMPDCTILAWAILLAIGGGMVALLVYVL